MIWPNLYNFSNKLPCLRIWMNLSRKSCKRCLISWKSTRNHRSGQIFITFRTNYHVFAFRWTFQGNVAKSASFREKAREIIDLGKLCNFSNKLPCLCISINFSGKSCKKCLIWWKNTKNHRFGQNLQFFEETTMSLAFSWTFQKEVAKSASYREKAREIIDFAKNCKFSKKLPSFFVSMNFMAKSCKNCLISWKSTKTHRFGQNYATFSNKLPCFGVSMNFWAKGCKKSLNSWESTKNHGLGQNFATFRTNYHVFALGSTFQEKVAKSSSFREKARKLIDLAKTFHFSSKLPCLGILMNF